MTPSGSYVSFARLVAKSAWPMGSVSSSRIFGPLSAHHRRTSMVGTTSIV